MTDLDGLIERALREALAFRDAKIIVTTLHGPSEDDALIGITEDIAQALASCPDTAFEAGKREGLEEAARCVDEFAGCGHIASAIRAIGKG